MESQGIRARESECCGGHAECRTEAGDLGRPHSFENNLKEVKQTSRGSWELIHFWEKIMEVKCQGAIPCFLHFNNCMRDLPGGPVAKTPCSQCRGPGFSSR